MINDYVIYDLISQIFLKLLVGLDGLIFYEYAMQYFEKRKTHQLIIIISLI
jgi:hypothetical protein